MKFLIVDDDTDILKVTKKFLELSGYEVVCCENALEAIQKLSDLSFDILITDATMPAYSGYDLIRSVKKSKELNYLTIAMLTGRSEKSDIEQAVELGVQDYIVKPIEVSVFMEKINRLIAIHNKKTDQKPKIKKFTSNAEMLVPIVISRVTDIGISIESPYPLKKGALVKINIEEFKNIGLMQNSFKAIFNTETSDNKILTELILIDLNPADQKKLSSLAKKWNEKKVA
jgi:CheY-like chemotaxis protein